jgi:hypothetical protein
MAGTAARMEPLDAINSIGNALAELCTIGPSGVFEQSVFPVPDQFYAQAGRPSAVVRFDGVANDDWSKYSSMPQPYTSPSDLRYAIRIYHVQQAPAEIATEDLDPYKYAQNKVAEGFSKFYVNMRANNRLGGLIEEIIMTGSITGDLVDPRSGETFWGMEIIVITTLY